MASARELRKIEYGDFQTPRALTDAICRRLFESGLRPASVLEPTCGTGNFLFSAHRTFPSSRVVGVDINEAYTETVRGRIAAGQLENLEVFTADFFSFNWKLLVVSLPEPLLVIGNLPWVTNAVVSAMDGTNLPEKTNFLNLSGLDALTGKSNFDISEWMLLQILGWIKNRNAAIAMLCKTSVARKVIAHAWKQGISLESAEIYSIDARKHFGATVEACLLVLKTGHGEKNCALYKSLYDREPISVLGFRDGRLVANVASYEKWKHLQGLTAYRWRSGIKHDCTRIMELVRDGDRFRNGVGEIVEIEMDYLYPMLKSSDLARGRTSNPEKWMLVTQRAVGKETESIRRHAPRTWEYLISHATDLDGRKSSIYKNRPRFSVFGVGDYSFAPWKVAISGLYKKLHFAAIGPYMGKPVVLDDTVYFIPCYTEQQARQLETALNSRAAREFFEAFIFWDAKRPITVDVLSQLSIENLCSELAHS